MLVLSAALAALLGHCARSDSQEVAGVGADQGLISGASDSSGGVTGAPDDGHKGSSNDSESGDFAKSDAGNIMSSSDKGSVPPISLSGLQSMTIGAPDFTANNYVRTWKIESDSSCIQAGEILLRALQAQDYELNRSGYIDLGSQCWSCTATAPSGEVLLISLMPSQLGLSISESNPLVIRIVELQVPGVEVQPKAAM
ncbi:MAG: hypothetical protein LBH87_02455 [Coriobacteriales bacterium]|jgi:hypothetical protein|nr:hypothetical protein [Coriobacteriales bacterium]